MILVAPPTMIDSFASAACAMGATASAAKATTSMPFLYGFIFVSLVLPAQGPGGPAVIGLLVVGCPALAGATARDSKHSRQRKPSRSFRHPSGNIPIWRDVLRRGGQW